MTTFADFYHLQFKDYDEDLPFWIGLAEKYGGPVLELGCGTGRVLLRMAQAGHQVCGLDNDPAMLAVAQREADALGIRAEFVQARLSDFALNRLFSLVISPCNTFAMLGTEERQRAFACVSRHLAARGAFAVSVPNPVSLATLPEEAEEEEEDVLVHPASGNPVQVSSAWTRKGREVVVMWRYDHLLPDGNVERTIVPIRYELTSAEDYQSEIIRAGLNVLNMLGNFDGAPYEPDSPYLILIAGKPKDSR